MKYSKATNYALHTVAYMTAHDKTDNLGLQMLASHFNISATYLSKILTQLVKAGLVQSTPGVNGGYVLRKKKEDISFMDVIKAIEGTGALFNCELHEEDGNCRILKVMAEAENVMETYLQNKKIYEVVQKTTTDEIGKE
ncbi:Rrf2 family transcriptional regulator [Clostridium sp. CX1]|uniref:Rrf2 family transcriptional regulator n=1 Tax=Clostridium tanneri TaxID=3037988 RepID=A0ABU4JXT4_9CLOT|nr:MULTISPECIES: Rrf2 family transcriptional regulator [unclassified Clostridium]MCT8975135.1 Rrf2 family transcriptional regulator [Clostridium sp. CX1]MDW8802718.1 Rrf2 family transcriptional regulator [Clostridium sp. A1-XYC3]